MLKKRFRHGQLARVEPVIASSIGNKAFKLKFLANKRQKPSYVDCLKDQRTEGRILMLIGFLLSIGTQNKAFRSV